MSQTARHLGRFKMNDAGRRTRDLAEKTLVAEFDGLHFVAEREDDRLCIYSIGSDDGTLGVNVYGATGDRRGPIKNLGDLQRTFDNFTKSLDRRFMTPRRG
jgi:hypothetical protein